MPEGDSARDTGYRYWRVQNGRLFSPLAGDPLPNTGTLIAGCHRPHRPPFPGCVCGVSFYRTQQDMRTTLEGLDLDPDHHALTVGTITRPTISDTQRQLYTFDVGWAVTPPAYRCRAYTITTIYTDRPLVTDYGASVHPLASFHA